MIKYPLQADRIKKTYHDRTVVDLTLQIKRNEVLGIVGKNGSGKTTTLNMLCGVLQPDSGTIYVENQADVAKNSSLKKLIAYLTEEKPDIDNLTVAEYLNFVCHIYNQDISRVKSILSDLNVTNILHTPFAELSKGYRQKVMFASILIADTPIMVFDELTDGLDPAQQKQVFDLINNIKQDKTIIISSHNMQELLNVCDKLIVLNKGKIIKEINSSEVSSFEKFANLLK